MSLLAGLGLIVLGFVLICVMVGFIDGYINIRRRKGR